LLAQVGVEETTHLVLQMEVTQYFQQLHPLAEEVAVDIQHLMACQAVLVVEENLLLHLQVRLALVHLIKVMLAVLLVLLLLVLQVVEVLVLLVPMALVLLAVLLVMVVMV
jgi:hypothetical protein